MSSSEPDYPPGAPVDPAAAQRTTRAGRDLPAAIGVGLGLGALIIASLFFAKIGFIAIVLAAAVLGIVELTRALATCGTRLPLVPLLVGGTVTLCGGYFGGVTVVAIGAALTTLAIMLWRLREGADGFVRDVTAAVFVLAYVPVLGSFVVLLLAEDDGPWRIVTFIVCTIASDIFGYAAGATLGKHPMAPTISPRKSWEGFAGAVLGGLVAGVATVVLALEGHWWVGLLLGAASVVMATLGDLFESLIKRDLRIKDMGDLLPGHGGMMDRLDSLLAVAPVAWLIMYLLVPVSRA
ncbi:MAG: phosphatidate cytidylyltransferase [Mycobacteriales bacterium]